ncbi:helix-turn-helix domain-containing protein [Microbacterium sp. MMO-10]|uniref:helix-turn-helix domain-containing protein n=1 Tax=Microbacterium sp. MMO-10 TaxID=3081272 RepID=UPI003017028E
MTKWLNTKQAAKRIGFAAGTLENWRLAEPRRGPEFRRIGRAIRYDQAELDRFIESNGTAA